MKMLIKRQKFIFKLSKKKFFFKEKSKNWKKRLNETFDGIFTAQFYSCVLFALILEYVDNPDGIRIIYLAITLTEQHTALEIGTASVKHIGHSERAEVRSGERERDTPLCLRCLDQEARQLQVIRTPVDLRWWGQTRVHTVHDVKQRACQLYCVAMASARCHTCLHWRCIRMTY